MSIASMRREMSHFGLSGTIRARALRRAGTALRILDVLVVDQPDPEFLRLDPRYRAGFLDPDTIRRLSRDPAHDLPSSFVEKALAKGDRCHAILDGDTPASLGWYATTPTPVGGDLVLSCDGFYVYMYKGFTHHDHRGKRLHAIGMTLALQRLRAEGFAGIVSYVDAANLGSLRSCHRMGYRDAGTIVVAAVGRRRIVIQSGDCAHYGVKLTPAEPTQAGPVLTVQAG